jgi:hypothetical protein
VDGELISRNRTTALAFSFPRRVGLDMRHRLPGLSVGLAASLRSMPTACYEDYQVPIRLSGRVEMRRKWLGWQQQSAGWRRFLTISWVRGRVADGKLVMLVRLELGV